VWHDVPQQDTHIHTNGVSLHPTPHKSVLEKDVRETKPNVRDLNWVFQDKLCKMRVFIFVRLLLNKQSQTIYTCIKVVVCAHH